jgi:DNA-directed RNA polymerase specialized sigma24 family protein
MPRYDDTEIGGHQVRFATTHWTLLEQVRGPLSPAHHEVLNFLIKQYWKPVYYFIRRQHPRYDNEQAKDLTQDFFIHCLTKELFGHADQKKGRFRNLLLRSLTNFLANYERGQHAQKRAPVEGQIISIDAFMEDEDLDYEPGIDDPPEAVFDHQFTINLIRQVFDLARSEFLSKDQGIHYELLKRRVIDPFLQNNNPPSREDLAQEYGITTKQVSNFTITARRTFQRLFRECIRSSACSEEDVAAEVEMLSRFIAGT